MKRIGTNASGSGRFFRKLAIRAFAAGMLGLLCVSAAQATGPSAPERASLQKMGFILFDDREPAPNLNGPELSGGTVSLSAFRGKWVLLNFWATWCLPCRSEIPTLNRLNERMKGRPFVLLSVAMDYSTGKIRTFVRKIPVQYPIVLGRKGKIDERYFGMGLPQTYLLDPRGVLIGKVTGPRNWDTPDALTLFRALSSSGLSSSLSGPRKGSS